jgi:hypothetical protein
MRRGWSLWFVGRFLSHARRGFGGFHRCCHAHRFQQLRTAAAAGVAMVHYDGNKSNKSGSTSGNKRGTQQRSATRKAAIHNVKKLSLMFQALGLHNSLLIFFSLIYVCFARHTPR